MIERRGLFLLKVTALSVFLGLGFFTAIAFAGPNAPDTYTDDFNRSSLGSNWTTLDSVGGHPGLAINASTELTGQAGEDSAGIWDANTLGADQEVCLTITTQVYTGAYIGLYVRVTGENTGSLHGYRYLMRPSDNADFFDKVTGPNAGSNLASGSHAYADGDRVCLAAVGTDLIVSYSSDGGSTWTTRATVSDSTYTSGGKVGVWISNNGFRADNFSAGTVGDTETTTTTTTDTTTTVISGSDTVELGPDSQQLLVDVLYSLGFIAGIGIAAYCLWWLRHIWPSITDAGRRNNF